MIHYGDYALVTRGPHEGCIGKVILRTYRDTEFGKADVNYDLILDNGKRVTVPAIRCVLKNDKYFGSGEILDENYLTPADREA
jgi:ribosomal protein L24